jgi:hypothetical protein
MASTALTTFNTAVDGLAQVSNARKTQIKNIGETLFIAGARETILHLRKHIAAVAADVNHTAEVRARAATLRDQLDAMIATQVDNAWWLDVQALAEA